MSQFVVKWNYSTWYYNCFVYKDEGGQHLIINKFNKTDTKLWTKAAELSNTTISIQLTNITWIGADSEDNLIIKSQKHFTLLNSFDGSVKISYSFSNVTLYQNLEFNEFTKNFRLFAINKLKNDFWKLEIAKSQGTCWDIGSSQNLGFKIIFYSQRSYYLLYYNIFDSFKMLWQIE